jgi:DNA repair exonuclease SbcCD ATPase subunit
MRLSRISCVAFAEHDKFTLDLPPTGVVLVQGPNGSGKSTGTIEAVSFGAWKRGMRKRKLITKPTTSVELSGPGWQVIRSPRSVRMLANAGNDDLANDVATTAVLAGGDSCGSGGSGAGVGVVPRGGSSLRLAEVLTDAQEFTASKTQDRIDMFLGTWDRWRRSCVFTTADLAMFTLASDAERKQFFESVLGVDRFDRALENVKARGQDADLAHRKAMAEKEVLERQWVSLSTRLSCLTAVGPDGPRPEPLPSPMARLEELRKEGARLRKQADSERGAAHAVEAAAREAQAKVNHLTAEIASLGSSRPCPTCGVVSSTDDAEAIAAQRTRKQAALDVANGVLFNVQERLQERRAKLAEQEAEHARVADELETAAQQLSASITAYTERDAAIRQWDGAQALYLAQVVDKRKLSADLGAVEMKLDEIQEQCVMLQLESYRCALAEDVLGTRGVRARMLERLLATVTHLANEWLDLLTPPVMRVAVEGKRVSTSGAITDVISIRAWKSMGKDVVDDDRLTYDDMSTGQRKRIDIALLLALSAVSSDDSSTMFFDEVFDGLDAAGRAGVVSLINKLATTRCVVVITHDEFLAQAFPHAQKEELQCR